MTKTETIDERTTFIKLKNLQIRTAKIIPNITFGKYGRLMKKTKIPETAPIKFAETRSIVSLGESFSSGEMTRIIESNVQNKSYSGNRNMSK